MRRPLQPVPWSYPRLRIYQVRTQRIRLNLQVGIPITVQYTLYNIAKFRRVSPRIQGWILIDRIGIKLSVLGCKSRGFMS